MSPQAYGGGAEGKRAHEALLSIHKGILEKSGEMWNWPSVATMSHSTLARVLYLHDLYQQILLRSGDVFEFGVHFGTSASTILKLSNLLEPRSKSREFHFFDSFTGFPDVDTSLDGNSRKGDFFIGPEYEETLNQLLQTITSLGSSAGATADRYHIHAGEAVSELRTLLESGWSKRIALLILDLDLYSPTKEILELLSPYLARGSIIVLDEYGSPDYPGETLLEREIADVLDFSISHHPLMPYGCQLEIR